ncbi:YceI family protein [Ekhidna sp.]|uniref:YceI family protein n=1 Tax=Ekhidna sp. TaxID=2608089 RepID=UPI0035141D0C
MIRNLLIFILILTSQIAISQRFKSSQSSVMFYSDAPMEDIKAVNESATSLIDLGKKAIVIVVPIKSFEFQKKLMQEHFNENYLESDKYPNATFKGKIIDWSGNEGVSEASAQGTLEIHGVSQDVSLSGEINFQNNKLNISTTFTIRLEDYDIKIPKALFYNIAEEVEVTAKFEYKPYEKNN